MGAIPTIVFNDFVRNRVRFFDVEIGIENYNNKIVELIIFIISDYV